MKKFLNTGLAGIIALLAASAPAGQGLDIESPRLRALQQALALGRGSALTDFWMDVVDSGTPLVERIDDDEMLVTFLWRESEPLDRVVVVGGPGGRDLRENVMAKLTGSDVWYRSYRARSDLRTTYQLSPNDSLVPFREATDIGARLASVQRDPLNPKDFLIPGEPGNPIGDLTMSVVELPDAPAQPWVEPDVAVPPGMAETRRLRSAILDNERDVTIYTPPGHDPDRAEPYPLLVLFDRDSYVSLVPTQTILDNLIAAGEIPPLVAALVDNVNRIDELPANDRFADFLADELVPWVRDAFRASPRPDDIVVAGSSLGGLAATFAAIRRPEVFGNVLSLSGAYWWSPVGDAEPEWHARHIATMGALRTRVYQTVGLLESAPTRGGGPSMLVANRHMRDALQAKGLDVTYEELNAGHDFISWRGALAEGLIVLLGR